MKKSIIEIGRKAVKAIGLLVLTVCVCLLVEKGVTFFNKPIGFQVSGGKIIVEVNGGDHIKVVAGGGSSETAKLVEFEHIRKINNNNTIVIAFEDIIENSQDYDLLFCKGVTWYRFSEVVEGMLFISGLFVIAIVACIIVAPASFYINNFFDNLLRKVDK